MMDGFAGIMEWSLYIFFSVGGRFLIVCYASPAMVLSIVPIVLIFKYVEVNSASMLNSLMGGLQG